MKKILLSKHMFASICFLLFFSVVYATDYYVSLTGNDGNSGLAGFPKRTIQSAVNAASNGDIINVDGGLYVEDVSINAKSLTILGIGSGFGGTTVSAATTSAFSVSGVIGGTGLIKFQNIAITNSPNTGIRLASSANIVELDIWGCLVQNNQQFGLGMGSGTAGLGYVSIVNSTFIGNGVTAANVSGKGDISLFLFNGDALFENVVVTGISPAQYGIQMRSKTTALPAGNVVLNGVLVTGTYTKPLVGIIQYSDAAGFIFNNVTLGDATSTGWDALHLDGVKGTMNLGNTSFPNGVYSTDIFLDPASGTTVNVDASGTTIGGVMASAATLSQLFTMEDKILHRIDVPGVGFVKVRNNNDYVTPNSFGPPLTTAPSIQRGVDAASNGWTVNVAPGTYNEGLTVNKEITLQGSGSTTVIKGVGCGNTGITINNFGNNSTVKDLTVRDFNTGVFAGATNVELNNVSSIFNCNHGVELTTGSNIRILDCTLSNNTVGLRVGSGAILSDVTMDNCEVHNNVQGIYVAYESPAPAGTFDDVTISNSDFSDNTQKGMYFEKLSNATIESNIINHSGYDVNYHVNAGIDINLKWTSYSNISIKNNEITDCGYWGTHPNPLVITHIEGPVAITIKARDDSPTYSGTPASLSNVEVLNNIISGPQNGLRFGEFGKTNNTPTNVDVHENHLGGPFAYKALINNTPVTVDAECNWYGTIDPASKISGPVDYVPYLMNGTDNMPAVRGFQPVPGSCNGNGYIVCDQTPKETKVVMCHKGKTHCVKEKDIQKKLMEGWTLGPCTQSNCGPDETLMCKNGETDCVKNKDVIKKQGQGWVTGPCEDAPLIANRGGSLEEIIVDQFKLTAAPNPANSSTIIKYELPLDSKVNITLYDPMGRVVATLVEGSRVSGAYSYVLDASRLSAGLYFYKMIAVSGDQKFVQSQKLMIVK